MPKARSHQSEHSEGGGFCNSAQADELVSQLVAICSSSSLPRLVVFDTRLKAGVVALEAFLLSRVTTSFDQLHRRRVSALRNYSLKKLKVRKPAASQSRGE